jgi:hypothetical protein
MGKDMMCLRASISRKKFITFFPFNMGRISLAIEFGSDVMTHDTIMRHLKLRDNKLFRLLENS